MLKKLLLDHKVRKLNKAYYPICVLRYRCSGDIFIVSYLINGNGHRKVSVETDGIGSYSQRLFKRSIAGLEMKMWEDRKSNKIPDSPSNQKVEYVQYYHHNGNIFRKHIDDRYNTNGIDVIDTWET